MKKEEKTKVSITEKEARAIARYLRISPYKLRRVADQIRGKNALIALQVLNNLPQSGALYISKALSSAIANARAKQMSEEGLFIKTLLVNEGTQIKRFSPRARGRMYSIIKRTSHIVLVLSELGGDR